MKETDRTRTIARLATTIAASAALAACGGGSSDSTSGTIDRTNAIEIANVAYMLSSVLYEGSASLVDMVDLKSGPTPSRQGRPGLVEFTLQHVLDAEASIEDSRRRSAKAIETEQLRCSVAGYATLQWNDADNSGDLSTGDTLSIRFVDCLEDDGTRLSGTMTLSNLQMSGSAYTSTRYLRFTTTYSSLQMISNHLVSSVHGDLSMQVQISNTAPYWYDATISGRTLQIADDTGRATLESYSSTVRVNYTAGTYAHSVAGIFSGTGLPSRITLRSQVPLQGKIGSWPTTGSTIATAANGTAVRLVADSAASVTVELDADADGLFEAWQTMSWRQLVAP